MTPEPDTAAEPTLLRSEVTVATDPATAFAIFTERFGEVKPREHNLLAAPLESTVLEPRVGGAIVDRGVDGSECRWAHIRAWEPPHRLVFSWDIGPDWELVTDPEQASEVEITFAAQGPGRTRVLVEHRHLDRHGPGWGQLRDQLFGEHGWPLWLERYHRLSEPAAASS